MLDDTEAAAVADWAERVAVAVPVMLDDTEAGGVAEFVDEGDAAGREGVAVPVMLAGEAAGDGGIVPAALALLLPAAGDDDGAVPGGSYVAHAMSKAESPEYVLERGRRMYRNVPASVGTGDAAENTTDPSIDHVMLVGVQTTVYVW